MGREILFRAKRIDNDEWIEGLLTVMFGQYHIISTADENTAYPINPETICQYTGAKDKNGAKIWENDILRYSYDYPGSPWLAAKGLTDADIRYSTGAVFWQDYRAAWAVCGRGKSQMVNQNIFTYTQCPNRTEVIGNIFDNPELLEQEKGVGKNG